MIFFNVVIFFFYFSKIIEEKWEDAFCLFLISAINHHFCKIKKVDQKNTIESGQESYQTQ
jgi:hypothetical protein